jgi:hypothetical protein
VDAFYDGHLMVMMVIARSSHSSSTFGFARSSFLAATLIDSTLVLTQGEHTVDNFALSYRRTPWSKLGGRDIFEL